MYILYISGICIIIAYGFLGTVDSMGPYDVNAMTLFDYR